jgi:hypothetical protein
LVATPVSTGVFFYVSGTNVWRRILLNLGLVFVKEGYTLFPMRDTSSRYLVLDLTALFVQRNVEFTEAVKQKLPADQLKTLHSELQELYNHITILRQAQYE